MDRAENDWLTCDKYLLSPSFLALLLSCVARCEELPPLHTHCPSMRLTQLESWCQDLNSRSLLPEPLAAPAPQETNPLI